MYNKVIHNIFEGNDLMFTGFCLIKFNLQHLFFNKKKIWILTGPDGQFPFLYYHAYIDSFLL